MRKKSELLRGVAIVSVENPEVVHKVIAKAVAKVFDGRAYGEWCRRPEACKGKGYCPLDPTCGD